MSRSTTSAPWIIRWYVCTADPADVAHAKTEGRKLKVGDELWRVPTSIGPITTDKNHWAGDHLDCSDDDANLAALAPELRDALTALVGGIQTNNLDDALRGAIELLSRTPA